MKALRLVLAGRGLINVAFAIYFLVSFDVTSNFVDGGVYALTDGAFALVAAALLYRLSYDTGLVGLAVADALVRLECGTTMLLYPSRETMPTVFLGSVALTALLLGGAGITWAKRRRTKPREAADEIQPPAWPIAAASIALIIVGVLVIFLDPVQRRVLVSLYALSLGLILLVAEVRRAAAPANHHRPKRTTRGR